MQPDVGEVLGVARALRSPVGGQRLTVQRDVLLDQVVRDLPLVLEWHQGLVGQQLVQIGAIHLGRARELLPGGLAEAEAPVGILGVVLHVGLEVDAPLKVLNCEIDTLIEWQILAAVGISVATEQRVCEQKKQNEDQYPRQLGPADGRGVVACRVGSRIITGVAVGDCRHHLIFLVSSEI